VTDKRKKTLPSTVISKIHLYITEFRTGTHGDMVTASDSCERLVALCTILVERSKLLKMSHGCREVTVLTDVKSNPS
jgi:hypothetical protein